MNAACGWSTWSNRGLGLNGKKAYFKWPLGHDLVKKLAARHELHNHVDLVLGGHDLLQVHYIGVMQILHDGNLTLDLLHHALLVELVLVNDLQQQLLPYMCCCFHRVEDLDWHAQRCVQLGPRVAC